jgi:hypothetical protein
VDSGIVLYVDKIPALYLLVPILEGLYVWQDLADVDLRVNSSFSCKLLLLKEDKRAFLKKRDYSLYYAT